MPPASSLVVAPGATPARTLLFLHGILGRGANLRPIARRVVAAHPEWAVALVDLREHGASRGSPDLGPPHTVAAAARDLLSLDGALPAPVRGVLGHSFGGKVLLEYLRLRPDLDELFSIDSSPAPRPAETSDSPTREVIAILSSLPERLPSREALVERVVAAGLSRGVGEWLAMNLERRPDGADAAAEPGDATEPAPWTLALDLAAIRALVEDYFAADLWPLVDALPGTARLHVVIGDRSRVWPPADRAHLERVARAHEGRVDVTVLDTGHWVHVEDPEGLSATIDRALGTAEK